MSAGMAKHSDSSFNENTAVRMLEQTLESTKKIKTFFKENDRTPNYDGSFELIDKEGTPKKQFIVQIKKSKAIKKQVKGKNVGKYVYLLDTSFLYYIKAKVTESPAIYFVVDIENKRIFYLYLSDDILMELNFEGKKKVSYSFSENQVLSDVDKFYSKLLQISNTRNLNFIFKSKEEISDMQDAVEYINDLFNGDLKSIKEACFPGLWRFGIGISKNPSITIIHTNHDGKRIPYNTPSSTNMYGLYPQYKGKINQEIGEYQADSLTTIIDCCGNKKPIEYVKETVKQIIQSFCQNPPANLLPSIVLQERIISKAQYIYGLLNKYNQEIFVDELFEMTNNFFAYIFELFLENHIDSENEKNFKQVLKNAHMRKLNVFNPFIIGLVADDFSAFANERNGSVIDLKQLFNVLDNESIEFFIDILELKDRNVKGFNSRWLNCYKLLRTDDVNVIKGICSEWLEQLPDVYYEFYENVFSNNKKYLYDTNAEYCIKPNISHNPITGRYYMQINHYRNSDGLIHIKQNEKANFDFFEVDEESNVISKTTTGLVFDLILGGRPLYDGIRCWMYQGIIHTLKYKNDGLYLTGRGNVTLF